MDVQGTNRGAHGISTKSTNITNQSLELGRKCIIRIKALLKDSKRSVCEKAEAVCVH